MVNQRKINNQKCDVNGTTTSNPMAMHSRTDNFPEIEENITVNIYYRNNRKDKNSAL